MNKTMKYIFLCVCLMMYTACSFIGSGAEQTPRTKADVLYSVTDATGTHLEFDQKPQRIISLNVSIDEILLDLAEPERITALSSLADDASICSAADKAKTVSGRASSSDLEQIVMMQPDLILVPDYSNKIIDKLRSLGFKVYVCKTPSDVQSIFSFIREIGSAIGEPQAGDDMAQHLKERMESIRCKIESSVSSDRHISVAALSFTGPLGSRGTFSDLCYYAGIKNCFADNDIVYEGIFPQEMLIKANPDMIITPDWDFTKKNDPEEFRRKILTNSAYHNLKAIRSQKVYTVHSSWLNSTSQYVFFAVQELAGLAYPQLDFNEHQ